MTLILYLLCKYRNDDRDTRLFNSTLDIHNMKNEITETSLISYNPLLL